MDFLPLKSVFDGAGAVLWGALITYFVLVIQSVSFIPMPEGSRVRTWAIGILCALVMALAVADRGQSFSPNYAIAVALSLANLIAAAAGIRAATKVALPQLTDAANGVGQPPKGSG